ncbi:MAG: NAD-dependent epimerase/dehydratase family protein [archaeon]
MILVTGGTGLIGRALVKELIRRGERVRVFSIDSPQDDAADYVQGDITDYTALRKAAEKCSVIFHLAALVSYDAHKIPQAEYDRVNVGGTENVLKVAEETGATVVFMSSVAAGRNDTKYSISKNKAEKLVHDYSEKVRVIIIRAAPVYGSESPKFTKMMKYIEHGLLGRIGKDVKTHLVEKDSLVKALLLASKKGNSGEVYVIADKNPILASELYSIMANGLGVKEKHYPYWAAYLAAVLSELYSLATGKKAPLTRDYLLTLTISREYDFSKAQKELGFKPADTKEGAKRMVAWYKLTKTP